MNKSVYFAVLFAIVSVLLYNFSSIQVPEGFNNPQAAKLIKCIIQSFETISKLVDAFGIKSEPIAFKTLYKSLEIFQQANEDDKIKVEDVIINNLPVKIYQPTSKINEKTAVIIYYHGGGFVFGSVAALDAVTQTLSKKLEFKVIPIEYRLAPEYKYPIPINDCIETTEYILDNAEKYNIDLSKVVLAGDSAGGNAVAVVTRHLVNKAKNVPKLQVMVYPWLQQFNFRVPSFIHYLEHNIFPFGVGLNKLVLWYLGIEKVTDEMVNALKSNNHTFLLDDVTRLKLAKYVDTDLIPNEYKTASYYQGYKKFDFSKRQLDADNILIRDKKFAETVLKLFNPDLSPGLADDEQLRNQPKAFIAVVEIDELKDEALIYAQRLRNNGGQVEIGYYENLFHGSILSISDVCYNKDSLKMIDDIVNFIRKNI